MTLGIMGGNEPSSGGGVVDGLLYLLANPAQAKKQIAEYVKAQKESQEALRAALDENAKLATAKREHDARYADIVKRENALARAEPDIAAQRAKLASDIAAYQKNQVALTADKKTLDASLASLDTARNDAANAKTTYESIVHEKIAEAERRMADAAIYRERALKDATEAEKQKAEAAQLWRKAKELFVP